jgi:hypothetical protein
MSIEFNPTFHPDPELGMTLVAVKKEDTAPQQAHLATAKRSFVVDAEVLLEGNDKEQCLAEIEKIYHQKQRSLEWLSRQGFSRVEFTRRFEETLDSFNSSCRESHQKWLQNQSAFHETTQKLSMIDKMIANINASSPPPLSQERVLHELDKNPLYLINRENMAEKMAIAQMGAIATDLLVEGAKAACKITPTTEKVCRTTLEFGKAAISVAGDVGEAALDFVGLKEPVKRIVTTLQERDNHSLKRHLETTYDIPREVTQNYIENTYATAPWLLSKPAGLVVSSFWKRIKGAKTVAETISDVPTVTTSPAPLNFPHMHHNLYSSTIPRSIEQAVIRDYNLSKSALSTPFACLLDHPTMKTIIPNVPFIKSSEETWLSSLFPKNRPPASEISTHYLKEGGPLQEIIAKITHQGVSAIVKERLCPTEIAQALLGIYQLRNLRLKHLALPTPIATGQYLLNGESRFFLAKTYVEGTAFDALIQQIGSPKTLFFDKRRALLEDFTHANFSAGRAYGEVQTKSVRKVLLSEAEKKIYSEIFIERFNFAGEILKKIDMGSFWALEKTSPQIQSILADFLEAPCPLSYGLGYVHPGQFTWASGATGPRFGLVSTENVPWTVGVKGHQPLVPTAKELHDFTYSVESYGIAHGLTLEELHGIRDAFMVGYHATYEGMAASEAASRFFELENSFRSIQSLAEGIFLGENVDRSVLVQLIMRTQQQMRR